ncbi:hypothetical protein HK405_010940, partial [Cladochytrium tenue]
VWSALGPELFARAAFVLDSPQPSAPAFTKYVSAPYLTDTPAGVPPGRPVLPGRLPDHQRTASCLVWQGDQRRR